MDVCQDKTVTPLDPKAIEQRIRKLKVSDLRKVPNEWMCRGCGASFALDRKPEPPCPVCMGLVIERIGPGTIPVVAAEENETKSVIEKDPTMDVEIWEPQKKSKVKIFARICTQRIYFSPAAAERIGPCEGLMLGLTRPGKSIAVMPVKKKSDKALTLGKPTHSGGRSLPCMAFLKHYGLAKLAGQKMGLTEKDGWIVLVPFEKE